MKRRGHLVDQPLVYFSAAKGDNCNAPVQQPAHVHLWRFKREIVK